MYRRQFLKAALGSGAAVVAGQVSGIAPLLGTAAAQNGDQQRTVNVDALNLRTGPGLGYGVVTVLSYGDIVSIAGGTQWADGYEWVEVAVWGASTAGWVASEFLSEGGGGGNPGPRDRVQVANGPLNVRTDPSLGGGIITSAPTGAYGTVLDNEFVQSDGYTWVYVALDHSGTTGWMALEFLSYIDVA